MAIAGMGKLEFVDLRTVWTSESGDFTPWLARPENLALLGETLDINLECEAQEKDVGPFRADILCKDTDTDGWVLIENQLERTDHSHLGQIMTYAAGLKAVTIVWIAERFTDEHRAALDWLNAITEEKFNFFGLEIELWRIGNSPVAPKFNAVCKPNDWSKRISPVGELTEAGELYLDYWTALRQHLEDKKSTVRIKKPQPQTWMTFPVGRTHFYLTAAITLQNQYMAVQLVLSGPNRLDHFCALKKRAAEIEAKLGTGLEWRELPEKKESHIRRTFKEVDPGDRDDWPKQHETIRQQLELFQGLFVPVVKSLGIANNGSNGDPA